MSMKQEMENKVDANYEQTNTQIIGIVQRVYFLGVQMKMEKWVAQKMHDDEMNEIRADYDKLKKNIDNISIEY